MISKALLAVTAAVLLSTAPPAIAGPSSEALAKCLVGKATGDDNRVLLRWIFFAMAANPDVSGTTGITTAQRSEADSQMAATLEKLVFTDCRTQASDTVRAEGMTGFQESFKLLGESAMRGMMASPATQNALTSFAQHLHQEQWAAFMKDAGAAK